MLNCSFVDEVEHDAAIEDIDVGGCFVTACKFMPHLDTMPTLPELLQCLLNMDDQDTRGVNDGDLQESSLFFSRPIPSSVKHKHDEPGVTPHRGKEALQSTVNTIIWFSKVSLREKYGLMNFVGEFLVEERQSNRSMIKITCFFFWCKDGRQTPDSTPSFAEPQRLTKATLP